MGYWENTTYIRHGSVKEVAHALDAVLEEEGMRRTAAPSPRTRLLVEPMQYDGGLDNDLWAFALFPGGREWVVIKSAPLELLAERAAGSEHMRLADVCRALGAIAFQINVYDGSDVVLVEVSKDGAVLMSGFNGQSDNPMEWNGIEVTGERIQPMFELHDLGHLIAGNFSGDDFAQAVAREIGGKNASYCDNLVAVDTLICHKPFDAPNGQSLYYGWNGPSRQKRTPSNTYEQYGLREGEKT